MITHADSVLITVNNVLNTDAQLEIQSSIANLNTTISNFRSISETIDNSLAEDGALNQTIDNLAELTDDLSLVSSTLKDANLGVTFDDLGSAVSNLSQILGRIERGRGHLGNSSPKTICTNHSSKRISRSNCFWKICVSTQNDMCIFHCLEKNKLNTNHQIYKPNRNRI